MSDVLAPRFADPAGDLRRSAGAVLRAVVAVWSSIRKSDAGARAAVPAQAVPASASAVPSAPGGGDLKPADAEALMRQIVDEYRRPLLRFLTRLLLGQEELAEDLVQETLLRAWRNRESLAADPPKIAPWLYTVARHVAIDAMRARQARPPEVSLPDLNRVADADDEMDRVVSVHAVRLALTKISPEHRAVLLEMYYRGASVAEAAARLGIPEGTVKSRAYYAVRSLHAAIGSTDISRGTQS
ncbi:sigma-70 family RNA polymerase sigma factor [Actinoplanes sp. NPDC051851]|uniref:sigma-70 family RNA polymerase sigma factor n=1 Tax=Actinoplanes sp. NPDC051851 TaxID=3154753 RepID=UPI00343A0460